MNVRPNIPMIQPRVDQANRERIEALRQQMFDVCGVPRVMFGQAAPGFAAELRRYQYVPRPRTIDIKDDYEPLP